MTDLSEILQTYLFFLLPWPGAFVSWAIYDGGLSALALWLGVGPPVAYVLHRFARNFVFLSWLIVWFMPGTIICGSATLWPWAFALVAAFGEGGCSTPLSLFVTLAINAAIVIALSAAYRRLRRPAAHA